MHCLSLSLEQCRLSTLLHENKSVTKLSCQQQRLSDYDDISLFDGTDQEKWKLYGVYIGSSSDSSNDGSSDCEHHTIDCVCEEAPEQSNIF